MQNISLNTYNIIVNSWHLPLFSHVFMHNVAVVAAVSDQESAAVQGNHLSTAEETRWLQYHCQMQECSTSAAHMHCSTSFRWGLQDLCYRTVDSMRGSSVL
jgi:hypothetical protein